MRLPGFMLSLIALAAIGGCSRGGGERNGGCQIDTFFVKGTVCDTVYIRETVHDTVFVKTTSHDTLYVQKFEKKVVLLAPPKLDSVQTRRILDESLWKNYIDVPKDVNRKIKPTICSYSDLEYLPYMYLNFSNPTYALCGGRNYDIVEVFMGQCTRAIDDRALYLAGKKAIDIVNAVANLSKPEIKTKRNGMKIVIPPSQYPYPDSFEKGYPQCSSENYLDLALTAIDTMRVRAIVHNDRGALEKLERYYKKKGDDKGIAVYYKVMLGYEGNGDLAERFFRVLEPYFDETPEFRIAVREVLLRAAHCDHDRRAQELCDSLGFSLCDYRLPVISEKK